MLKGILSIDFSRGDAGHLLVLLDPRQIKGPGTYSFNDDDGVFERKDGATSLAFNSFRIKDNDEDKAEVVFVSTSGKINFTAFSKHKGERLTAAVSGERVSGTAG